MVGAVCRPYTDYIHKIHSPFYNNYWGKGKCLSVSNILKDKVLVPLEAYVNFVKGYSIHIEILLRTCRLKFAPIFLLILITP